MGLLEVPSRNRRLRSVERTIAVVVPTIMFAGCGDSLPTPSSSPTPSPTNSHTLALTPLATLSEDAAAAGSQAPVSFDGSTLLVPLGASGLAVYDLGDPGHPRRSALVAPSVLGGQGGAVAGAAGRVFIVLADRSQLAELDVSRPPSVRVLSRLDVGMDIERLALRGSRLFAQVGPSTTWPGGVAVFDVSGSPPVEAGEYPSPLMDLGFHVTAEGRVFLARISDQAKIDVVDMAVPSAPVLLGTWTASRPLNVVDIDVQEGKAYCAGYWGGLVVLAGADDARLASEADLDWPDASSYASSVAAAPPYVFVARGETETSSGSFQAFRADGSSLSPVWEQAATFTPQWVAISGNLLVTVELQSPHQTAEPQKVLKLYRIFDE